MEKINRCLPERGMGVEELKIPEELKFQRTEMFS